MLKCRASAKVVARDGAKMIYYKGVSNPLTLWNYIERNIGKIIFLSLFDKKTNEMVKVFTQKNKP